MEEKTSGEIPMTEFLSFTRDVLANDPNWEGVRLRSPYPPEEVDKWEVEIHPALREYITTISKSIRVSKDNVLVCQMAFEDLSTEEDLAQMTPEQRADYQKSLEYTLVGSDGNGDFVMAMTTGEIFYSSYENEEEYLHLEKRYNTLYEYVNKYVIKLLENK